ncbi:beta strand repeat-containing protein, partial [Uliginosibacterium sp. sgz301328]|uniref:beta strand repeat-containing protein n=1 Tax=Uliginosibacterium sp. sgz301328 TaxID=3243764 RepID=UPI00359CD12B
MLTSSAPAWSQSQCSATGGVYECAGTITEGVVISGSGDITVNSTADIAPTAAPGTGINVTNTGAGSITVNQESGSIAAWTDPDAPWLYPENGGGIFAVNTAEGTDIAIHVGESASVSSSGEGIYVENHGTGATSVSVAGDVTSAGQGISAYGDGATTDLTITQDGGAISGDQVGINALNYGSGATTVTVSGDVTGVYDVGIRASNASTTGADLTVIQNGGSISGPMGGIRTDNYGNGATNISVSGNVSGIVEGIHARNGGDTTGLTITQRDGTVSGNFGIVAENDGVGATTIDVAGNITAAYGAGINVMNGATTSGLTVVQRGGAIVGTSYGISANNSGTGAIDINVAGDVTSQSFAAISAYNATATTTDITITQSAGNITGSYAGIDANNYGTGATSVTVAGNVTGTYGYGINAYNDSTATDLTITQSAGAISGAKGIYAQNHGTGATHVSVAGDVTATEGSGIDVTGGFETTDLKVIQNGGTIAGYENGIIANNAGTGATEISTAGDVSGRSAGIDVYNGPTTTDLTITQTGGTITAESTGIRAENAGSGSTIIQVAGDVTGGQSFGIYAANDTATKDLTVAQSAGTINGGIYALNEGTGATSVSVAGDVTSTSTDGLHVSGRSNTTDLTITQSGGTISASEAGIFASNAGTGATYIATAGDVVGGGLGGILATNGSTSTDLTVVQSGGTITGVGNALHAYNSGSGTTNVSVAGDLTSTSSNGIYVVGGNETTDLTFTQSGGAVTGAYEGISVDNEGTGATSISLAGNVTGASGNGLYVLGAAQTTDLTVSQSGGTVTGLYEGILAYNTGTGATHVSTAGNVAGENSGLHAYGGSDTIGMTVAQTAGTITGGRTGIYVENFGTGATNVQVAGDVVATEAFAVYAYGDAATKGLAVTQSAGTVSGALSGIVTANSGTGATNIDVAGNVTGNTNYGIYAYNDAATTDLTITQS